ncbi:transposase [Sporosarcina sp. Te-1]|nr:transposase [Sporosarcina sp. Te-1]
MDDFAFRKGHTYGTMICDHQQGIPLALLPDRLPETVTAWLERHPSIQVISRDGFTAFRQAITQANPEIHQVYDRWHFIRNAKRQVDTHLATLVPASITWMEPPAGQTAIPLTVQERDAAEKGKRGNGRSSGKSRRNTQTARTSPDSPGNTNWIDGPSGSI